MGFGALEERRSPMTVSPRPSGILIHLASFILHLKWQMVPDYQGIKFSSDELFEPGSPARNDGQAGRNLDESHIKMGLDPET